MDNWGIYTVDGEVCVDFLGKFENLAGDFQHVINHLGLPSTLSLPKINSSSSLGKAGAYRSFYSDSTRELVNDWYANEIKFLHYSF